MKKISYLLVLSFLILYILFFPGPAVAAASQGLVLWYTQMLPTLLPFAILSYILIRSGLLNALSEKLHRLLRSFLPVSAAGIYPLAAGFLFGFPMGSKITAQLVEEGQMSYEEGNRLFSVCNNISPVFISGFILTSSLEAPRLRGATLALLYLPPLVYGFLQARLGLGQKKEHMFRSLPPGPSREIKKAAPRSQINFKIIDAGIMNGFETLTRLGGYIMLFAVLSQMLSGIPGLPGMLRCTLAGLMEITNGIDLIAGARLPFETKYLMCVTLTAFGGLSGLAQTASMVKEAGFSMKAYLTEKLVCSACTLLLAYCCLPFLL